ncbi:hypothetical protein KNP414_03963 [Paenibacillus mucilaginosus KNP414]|uniref:Uncharacterized protein n=1 Tax=Paenibacillus mucilaginosus (strain KNP414) TaxID=1036673 RepID=F8F953_PAEMK|nr:hypothetical protein KNP414_03963 [Paenibacillus mucilaginosus KNP414]
MSFTALMIHNLLSSLGGTGRYETTARVHSGRSLHCYSLFGLSAERDFIVRMKTLTLWKKAVCISWSCHCMEAGGKVCMPKSPNRERAGNVQGSTLYESREGVPTGARPGQNRAASMESAAGRTAGGFGRSVRARHRKEELAQAEGPGRVKRRCVRGEHSGKVQSALGQFQRTVPRTGGLPPS